MPGELGSLKTLAREQAEPLRFDASGTNSAQSNWLTKGKVRTGEACFAPTVVISRSLWFSD
jgi:hypothetical protein